MPSFLPAFLLSSLHTTLSSLFSPSFLLLSLPPSLFLSFFLPFFVPHNSLVLSFLSSFLIKVQTNIEHSLFQTFYFLGEIQVYCFSAVKLLCFIARLALQIMLRFNLNFSPHSSPLSYFFLYAELIEMEIYISQSIICYKGHWIYVFFILIFARLFLEYVSETFSVFLCCTYTACSTVSIATVSA